MADGKVVIDIEAEDSGLEKTLEDVGDAAKETEKDIDGLGDKAKKTESAYDKLTKAIDDQQEELTDLANEYKKAVVNFGKNSTEAAELKQRMKTLNDELKDNKAKMDGAEKSAKKFSSALDGTEGDTRTLDVALGNLVAQGIGNLISSLGSAVSSVMELADATREYREDMAKLDAAFTTAGHTTETAGQLYEDFYAILGESDRSVEAVNHLAELTDNTEELSKWSTIAAGVTAKFGDSLPIEGLTEAANETAKVGAVTGPLADALNWAGISEDAFNEKLAKCNSEQERASLITETLNELYSDAADEYNELTKSTQDARRATSKMEEAQANMGAAIEPVTTAWTELKANALEALVPVVKKVSDWLTKLSEWMDENPGKAKAVKAAVIGIATALGVVALALAGMTILPVVTAAFAAFNTTLLANPITWVVAAVVGLVAAFIYLWNNCEGFRNFWLTLWSKIKEVAGAAGTWFRSTWSGILSWFKSAVATIKDFFANAWANIKAVFSNSIIGAYFKAIWATIKGVFSVVKNVLSGNWSAAWQAIKNIVGAWRNYFATIWEKIKGVFSNVGGWFKSKFNDAKNKVLDAFSGIKDRFKSIGTNIVNGIWNGISNGYTWIKNKNKGWVGNVISFVKELFGIHSPSTVFRDEVGEMLPPGMGEGFENALPKVEQQMAGDIDALTARMQATVAAESIKVGNGYAAQYDGTEDIVRAVGMQTAGINSLANEYRRGSSSKQPIVLMVDKRELGRAVVDVSNAETERVGLSY